MPEDVRDVETVGLSAPEQIVEAIRDVLDGAIVRRKSVGKKIVPERFENQEGTLNERVRSDEIFIVPDELAAQGRKAGDNAADDERQEAEPFPPKIPPQVIAESGGLARSGSRFGWRRSHVRG